MQCPSCGAEVPESESLCPRCLTPLRSYLRGSEPDALRLDGGAAEAEVEVPDGIEGPPEPYRAPDDGVSAEGPWLVRLGGIEHELGSLERRLAGKALDYLGLYGSGALAALSSRLVGGPTEGAVAFTAVAVWGFGFWRYFNRGQTPGMWLVGVRALDELGDRPTGTALVEPWFDFRLWPPDFGLLNAHDGRTRGDRVSGTYVVRTRPPRGVVS